MKLKVSVVGSPDVLKLVLEAHPGNVAELHHLACEKFGLVPHEFTLQYFDTDFNEFVNLTDVSEVSDLMSLRLCNKKCNSESTSASVTATDTELRQATWPKTFELPTFDHTVQLFLKTAEEDYVTSDTTAVVPRDIKTKMLDALADKVFSFTAYASGEQIKHVAKSLVKKYPSLQSKTTPNGWEAWENAIAFKMGNFRSKMRRLGCQEVQLNGGRRSKFSHPTALPSAANIKKARKGEVNFLPNIPVDETQDSLEQQRVWMLSEMKKADPDLVSVNRCMAKTFAYRRQEITKDVPLTSDVMERWPALFTTAQVMLSIMLTCHCYLLQFHPYLF